MNKQLQAETAALYATKGAPITILVAMFWAGNRGEGILNVDQIVARTPYSKPSVSAALQRMKVIGLVIPLGDGNWQLTKGGDQLVLGEIPQDAVSDDQMLLLPLPPAREKNFFRGSPPSLISSSIVNLKREEGDKKNFFSDETPVLSEAGRAMIRSYIGWLRETVGIADHMPTAPAAESAEHAGELARHFTPEQVAEVYWHYKTDPKDTFWHSKELKLKHLSKLVPEFISAKRRKETHAHKPSNAPTDEDAIQRDIQARNARRS